MKSILMLFSIIGVLSGCAVSKTIPSGPDYKLKPGDSIVTISFRGNKFQNNLYKHLYIKQYDADRVKLGDLHVEAIQYKMELNESFFSFSLKPGKYRLSELRSAGYPESYWYIYLDESYVFTLEPDTYLDLGSIVMTQTSNDQHLQLIDDETNANNDFLMKLESEYFKNINDRFKDFKKISGWRGVITRNDKPLLEFSKNLTQFVNNPTVISHGVLFGSNLGQVLFRNELGEWKSIDVVDYGTFLWVDGNNQDDFFTTNDRGALFHYAHGSVREVGLPDGYDSYINFFGKDKSGFSLIKSYGGITKIYHSKIGVKGDFFWKELYAFGMPSTTKGDRLLSRSGSLVSFLGYDRKIYFYNLDDLSLSGVDQSELPYEIKLMPNGYLIAKYGNRWVRNTKISKDRGVTWLLLDVPFDSEFAATDSNHLYRLDRSGALFLSTDWGVTWSSVTSGYYGSIWSISGQLFLKAFLSASGAVQVFSLDKSPDGYRWVMERDTSWDNAIKKLKQSR